MNAANKKLEPGEGVDGLVRLRCGPRITAATTEIWLPLVFDAFISFELE